MRGTAGEVRSHLQGMFSYGLLRTPAHKHVCVNQPGKTSHVCGYCMQSRRPTRLDG